MLPSTPQSQLLVILPVVDGLLEVVESAAQATILLEPELNFPERRELGELGNLGMARVQGVSILGLGSSFTVSKYVALSFHGNYRNRTSGKTEIFQCLDIDVVYCGMQQRCNSTGGM